MAVIPSTQLDLGRQRKLLAVAVDDCDWKSVKTLDQHLVQKVAEAADDPARELSTLLRELRLVVGLYRNILRQCDDSVRELANQIVT